MANPEKMGKLTGLLASTSWDTARMARRRRVELIGSSILFASGGLYLQFLIATQPRGGAWWDYLSLGCGEIFLILGLLLLIWYLRWQWSEWQQMRTAALALRAAAEEGNEQLAPLAAEQPIPLSSEELAAGPERFALFGSWKDSGLAVAGAGVLMLLIGAGLAAILVLLVILNSQPDSALVVVALIIGGLLLALAALIFVMMGLLFLVLSWIPPLRTTVIADERGLRWWRSGWHLWPISLHWNAAKSFFVIAYAGSPETGRCNVYVLDAHHRLYLWRVYDVIPEDKHAMFERFNRVVATRSGLPLRDLSEAAAQVARIAEEPASDA